MFSRILFATTASPICDHAAHVAFDLAKKYHSKLILFHAANMGLRDRSPFSIRTEKRNNEMEEKEYINRIKVEINHMYAEKIGDVKDCQVQSNLGAPHTAILKTAHKNNVDLIIMGAHTKQVGSTRYSGFVGNTMQNVAKWARCPVLIVSRPCTTCFWYFNHIVFGTDFSDASFPAFLFAYQAAKNIGAKLYVFHAVNLPRANVVQSIQQDTIENNLLAAKKRLEKMYVEEMKEYNNYEIDVREGTPYVELLKFAREKNADLIVMAHHTREADPDNVRLGSTIEQVVLRSACPVTSVNRSNRPKTRQ